METIMTNSLKGKVAVVTGAAAGLGRAIAASLAHEGALVAILGRNADRLQQTAAELGLNVIAVPCDIRNSAQVRRAFSKVTETLGGVDILVNNAAAYTPFLLEDASDEDLRATFDTNVIGPAFCIRAAVPSMRARDGGDIVNISSESVRHPFPYLTAYAASKAALENLGLGLRAELRDDRIRVTTLRVGSMTGNETSLRWPPGMLDKFIAAITASGHAAFTGHGMSPQVVADHLAYVLALPREANLDLIELRAL
jgi:meso-butanediol dehydrogenase/(S,S)-butanediol dehydrogenase/diacetyl reductase